MTDATSSDSFFYAPLPKGHDGWIIQRGWPDLGIAAQTRLFSEVLSLAQTRFVMVSWTRIGARKLMFRIIIVEWRI
jgi:hypothetical protein